MTIALFNLGLASGVVVLNFVVLALVGHIKLGSRVAMGTRDSDVLAGHPVVGRLDRALTNSYHALILFTAATVIIVLEDKVTGMVARLGWIFVAARLAYIPIYAFDLNPWRSLANGVGLLATLGIFATSILT